MGVHEHTVGKWRRRFVKNRLDPSLTVPRTFELWRSVVVDYFKALARIIRVGFDFGAADVA